VKPVGWDIDPQDWRVRSAPKIQTYVVRHLKQLKGRAILLLHDVQPATVKALPAIIDWIDRENAERAASGHPPIKIIDYSYLVPPHPLVPPALDALGRVLIHLVEPPTSSDLRLWLGLAWLKREV
jgi:hypothetical protein